MPDKPVRKIVALFKRKAGLSMQEFIDYYENRHVPMMLKILAPYMMDYRRSFVCVGPTRPAIVGDAPDCDVITEAWFETIEAFERFGAEAAKHSETIARDEMNFVDRDSLRMFVVDERISDMALPGKR